nr:hypothetical protein [Tanacetum cinerariifolium]
MLDRTDFASWKQRIRLYCRGKDNGVNILKSIDEGPYKIGIVRETLAESTEGTPQFGPERPRVYSDMSSEEKDRYNVDIRATNILLQGLPKDIYTLINHYTDAKDIWDNVKMLLEGSELTKEDRESQLYDNFEHFGQHKEESIYDFYVRFSKIINDMRNIKITMSRMQLNSKFVNNMLPEWGRFVTVVKLNRGLRDSNYDQLFAYLKQHETHAKENKMMLERLSQPTVDPLALLSNVSKTQHHSPSSPASSSTQVPPPLANSISPTEDLIKNLTNMLYLFTQSYRTFLPQTNNQLRTSSNARNQATVQDDRVDLALNVDNMFEAEDCDAFDSDVDEAPTTQNMFIANLSSADLITDESGPSYDSDILSEVQDYDQYLDVDCAHHEEHVMHDSYVKDNEVQVVHSGVSSVLNDAFMMIYNDMCEPSAPSVSNTSRNAVVKNSLTSELATYREQVELPRPLYNELNKVAIGYKNPLCLTRAKQAQPTLYNGHEILKDNHAPTKVHNTEDTLEIAEITRKKVNAKMTDPECVTRKLKSEALKERTKVSRPIKAFMLYPPNTPARLVPRVLPTKSQVKIYIFTLIQLCLDFESTCKKRITPTGLTEGEKRFEQTKECYLKEVIPFFKTLKDNFEGIQKALTKEIKEMKDVFEGMEAEVAQCDVDRKHDAIDRKNLLIANDNLIAECLSQEVFFVAINFELNVARFTEMHVANTSVEACCLALEANLANLHDKSYHENQEEAENDKVKQHYKELYDSIKITRAKHIEQVTKLTTKNVTLKTSVSKDKVKPQILTRAKHAIDVEPIVPRLRNNRDAHLDYLSQLKESVETIRDIIEEAKVVRPQDRSIVSDCRYTKHSLELLEKKQVTVAKPSDRQDSNKYIHVVAVKPKKTNVPVPHFTEVKSFPKASGSQPKSNPKINRISLAKGANKLPVEDQHRTNKSHLRTANRVDSSSRLKRTVVQIVLWYLDSGCSKHMTRDRPLHSAPAMAPPVHADEEIVPYNKWVQIRKSDYSLDLDKKQSNPIFKMAVDLLIHTNFYRAFTASSTISSIYIQQFWDIIQYDKKAGNYRCQLDEQWFVLIKDTLREALQITPINNNQAFVAPLSAEVLVDLVNQLGYPRLVRNVSNIVTNDMFQPWRALTTILNLCLTGKTSRFERRRAPVLQILWNLPRYTTRKKRATLILIPSICFTKIIIHHLQRRHKFHPRPDSPLHLSNDEPVLGYLKFSTKGTKREVFVMPIPGSLITADIREASYYQEYRENVAKYRRFLAGETGSAQDSPAPKPTKPARKPKSTAQKAPPMPSATKTTDKPAKAKRIKHSAAHKSRKPRSSPKSVGASEAEKVPTVEPQVVDEDADYQKAVEESMKTAYAFPQGSLPPVVINEPESGKYQPLPEVPGKGKAKLDSEEESKKVLIGATEGGNDEDQAGPDPGAQAEGQTGKDADTLDEGQARSNPDEMSEGQAGLDPGNAGNEEQSIPSPVVHAGLDHEHMDLDVADVSPQPSTERLDKGDISSGDQFFSDKPSDADKNAETKVESMVNVPIQQAMSSISTSPIIDLSLRPVSPNVHQQFKATITDTTTTTTTTTTVPPP